MVAGAGIELLRRGGSGSDSPAADFSRVADRADWGSPWFTPIYDRSWGVRSGRAYYGLPAGERRAAPAQPFPIFYQDHECGQCDQWLAFRVSHHGLRPGLIVGATSIWDFFGATVELGRLVVAHYQRTTRTVLESRPIGPLGETDHHLRVQFEGGRLRAKLWRDGDQEPDWGFAMPFQAPHGSPGVLVVAPSDRRPATLLASSYDLASPSRAATAPGFTSLMSGPPRRAGGGWEVDLRACADRPCDVRFDWTTSGDLGTPDGRAHHSASAPPWTALQTVRFSGPELRWRAAVSRGAAQRISDTQVVRVPDTTGQLVLAAASCAQLWDSAPYLGLERLREAARPRNVDLFVYEGDLGYPGNIHDPCYLEAPDTFADRFKRTLADPYFRRLRRDTSTVMIMDDHDYGPRNNADRTDIAPWAAPVFADLMAAPPGPGYTSGRVGDVAWFTLDGRRYCDPVTDPNTPSKTKLGEAQRAWLERGLAETDAGLIVLFSADTFASRVSPDCWIQGWPDEYQRLMTLFMDQQLGGRRVVILSGDAHGMRIHYHPDPRDRSQARGLTVVEFVCSGLRARLWSMNRPGDPTVDPRRRVEGHSGLGMMSIDPPLTADRTIELRAINGDAGPIDLFPPLRIGFAPG